MQQYPDCTDEIDRINVEQVGFNDSNTGLAASMLGQIINMNQIRTIGYHATSFFAAGWVTFGFLCVRILKNGSDS